MVPEYVREQASLELARRHFWDYCKLLAPDFYKDSRTYLVDMCNELEEFVRNNEKILVINLPPRHGKSRTASKYVEWLFGQNNKLKVMTGSYNETLSGTFAKSVRDTIAEKKTEGIISYCDVFPNTKIKFGEASANKWALDGSKQANYLATSPTGTATGFGADIIIIDDLIKNSEEAYNELALQKQIDWFNNTMMSRTENGFKLIIIMTRWCTNDLAGYILNNFDNVRHINYKAQSEGKMLCDEILSEEDFKLKTKNMNKDIVLANYQQEPIDIKGRLYSDFKTYTELPMDKAGKPLFSSIRNYTDTADEGKDYLCSIDYGVYGHEAYILDILYTQDKMEITEPQVAQMMTKDNVGKAKIESNNGGKGFARNITNELKKLNNFHTKVEWFHQSQNKLARILSNSTGVMNNIYFPHNWRDRFPDFSNDILKFQKEGKNEHDDSADALTGVYESISTAQSVSFGNNKIM